MQRNLNALITIAFIYGSLINGLATAAPVTFVVVDQDGHPIEHAVIIAPGPAPTVTASQPAIMDQINKQFVPHVLTLNQGQSVVFPNSDNIRHHVYSFSSAKTFELKLYAKHPESPIAFDTAGIVVLGCNIHDTMVGYIIVSDSNNWGQTGPDGQATIELDNSMIAVRLWHPRKDNGVGTMNTVPLLNANGQQPITLQLTLIPEDGESTGFNNRFKRYGR